MKKQTIVINVVHHGEGYGLEVKTNIEYSEIGAILTRLIKVKDFFPYMAVTIETAEL